MRRYAPGLRKRAAIIGDDRASWTLGMRNRVTAIEMRRCRAFRSRAARRFSHVRPERSGALMAFSPCIVRYFL